MPLNYHAEILTLSGPDKALHYSIPEKLLVKKGSLVWVPLQGRKTLGLVLACKTEGLPYALKPILALVYEAPVLTEDLIELLLWMRSYYAVTAEGLLQTFLPAVVRKGFAMQTETTFALLASPADFEGFERRAPKQVALCRLLQEKGPLGQKILINKNGISLESLRGAAQKGWISSEKNRLERRLQPASLEAPAAPCTLNDEQAQALALIESHLGHFKPILLDGITGSGKTEVYLRAMALVLKQGGQVLYLVPELSLTPQIYGRLHNRFADAALALWHHQLSDGERLDTHQAIARGAVNIVLGARSAVFVPLPKLQLIIVDEEHEPSYKQEDNPRYHGRDVAIYRSKCLNIPCILGSATPSTESFLNAQQGRYAHAILSKRAKAESLPKLHMVDMRLEMSKTGLPSGPLSRLLLDKLQERLDSGQQSLLFINRRGYSRSCLCPACGFKALCPACSLALTYHRHDERLRCHLCQYAIAAFQRCPQCQSPKIAWKGLGTQRLEAILQRCFPKARVVRVDADTMQGKESIVKCLSALAQGHIDILVGTQILAKGLDFPKVTLVGLIDADMAFNMPDFRAQERGFQLLMQVSGRSGRGDTPGEVVIQSFDPQNALFTWAKQGDTHGFLHAELAQRKELGYPPYRRLIRHLFLGPDLEALITWTQTWASLLKKHPLPACEILGPAPAALEKCKHLYRYHFWYFTPSISALLPALLALRSQHPSPKTIEDRLDVDPVQVM